MAFVRNLRRRGYISRLHAFHSDLLRAQAARAVLGPRGSAKSGRELEAAVAARVLAAAQDCKNGAPPALVKPSALHGSGCFATRDVAAGEVVGLYPGAIIDRQAVAALGGAENIGSRRGTDDWLMWRFDGRLMEPTMTTIRNIRHPGYPSTPPKLHPLAIGHLLNHPPDPDQLNCTIFEIDLAEHLPVAQANELRSALPCITVTFNEETERLESSDTLETSIIIVMQHVAADTELFLDYNYEVEDEAEQEAKMESLPSWYKPVPKPGRPRLSDWANFVV